MALLKISQSTQTSWRVILTVHRHWFSEGWASTKNNTGQDVLEAGKQEQSGVL
jgi:hypothetical protein